MPRTRSKTGDPARRGPPFDFAGGLFFFTMMRGQVVRLLGHDGDRAQFDPFQSPLGCWLEISSVIGGRVVSMLADAPPEPLPRCDERARLRNGVCDAYIRALEGREGRLHATKTTLQLTEGLCSWLEAVESWTLASALTLAWTGAVRIEARPTFTISAWRTLHRTGPIAVEVTSDGSPAMRTAVPTAAHTLYPTVRAVVDAFREVTGLADMQKYEFSRAWDQWLSGGSRQCGDDGLFHVHPSVDIKYYTSVRPRRLCFMCNSYKLRATYNFDYPHGWRPYLDAMRGMCIDCTESFGIPEKVVRLWGAEFRVKVCERNTFFTFSFTSPVKVEHTDAEPRKEYYSQCRAVPAESMGIWQHMAYVACLAEDLFLRVVGVGRPRLKLTSALLGRLSEAIIRRILAHLKSAILPPSRAQLERGVPAPPHSPRG
jgi:hypothetical protein